MIVKNHVPLASASPQYDKFDTCGPQLGVGMPGSMVYVVDPGPTIPSITTSSTSLGYTGMSSGLTFASDAAHISIVITSTTFVCGTSPLGGTAGGDSGGGGKQNTSTPSTF